MYPIKVSGRKEFSGKQKRQLKRFGLIWDVITGLPRSINM